MAPASKAGRRALGGLAALLVLVGAAELWAYVNRSPNPSSSPTSTAAPARTGKCDRSAVGPVSLAGEFADATAGQTICLASGHYGIFRGGFKDGLVEVRPRPGAKVTMALELDSAVNVRIEGVTVTSAVVQGASRNVVIAHSRFTGLAVVHADRMTHANVIFYGNRHANLDTCTSCFQARLEIDGNSGHASGVVVSHSVFTGGNSDGIRADGNGIRIVHNEFAGLHDEDPFHTDPIQIYGGTHIVIRGNYFHDNAVSAAIMMADGGDHNVVEDNVVAGTRGTWAMTWYSDRASIIRHNTFTGGSCSFHTPCGMINLGAKPADPAGRGTIIRSNVLGGISNGGGGKTSAFRADHNLTVEPIAGAANVTGTPAYAGPRTRWAGHRLASGSPGRHAASDGTDAGIRRR